MSRSLLPALVALSRQRSLQILLTVALLYVVLVQFPFLAGQIERPSASLVASDLSLPLASHEDTHRRSAPARPLTLRPRSSIVSSLDFAPSNTTALSEFHTSVRDAFITGRKVFRELDSVELDRLPPANSPDAEENCPHSIVLKGVEFEARGRVMVLPCGLTLGSHITLVAKPLPAHPESDPKIALLKDGDQPVMVSQFMLELQGLKTVDGEDPPRILHFNPRLKGDWSERPVIEQNTCYRMQWGSALRCEGWKSLADDETVDGLPKCEKWIRDDVERSEESKMKWWLNRLIGRTQKVSFDWPYPFVENKLFVLTLSAGLEGYHVNVDGRHVTSFPYRTGFILEDATGLSVIGDLDVQSIYAASLPTSHPSFLPQRNLEMLPQWQSPPLPDRPVELFIGILSAGNHFAERMAVRRSWMSTVRESLNLVARFFVALHGSKEVNIELKKEAEFFGDIVIVPYMDSYDLVVMKTIAICEYGIRTVAAKYIMKCDDDTFVRIDSVMKEIKEIGSDKSLYIGNMNNHHKPQRSGKWAVTYEEWPEEDYPLYANGPGYIISSDIAHFIVSEFEKHTLRLFKMEDVSMGMWVEQFNSTQPVEYVGKENFCQFGCKNDYYTAHYQSPRQMICMWEKLKMGKAECCNMR